MEKEILQTANELNFKINSLKRVLSILAIDALNPRLMIEYDGDGREQEEIPISLNRDMVNHLKVFIDNNIQEYEQEFKTL